MSQDTPPPERGQHAFEVTLQEAIRRLLGERAPPLPDWVAVPGTEREGLKLARWVRRHADLALAQAGTALEAALGSSAQMLLVEDPDGWHLIDCREGGALLWSGRGEGQRPLSGLDRSRIRRILSLRPAQDLSPKVATDPRRVPGLLPFLREYRGRLVELVAAGLVVNFVAMLLPLFSSIVYDRVVGNGIFETLWALAIGMSLFLVLELVLKAVRSHTVETVACRLDARSERQLLNRLLDQRGPMPPVGLMLARYRDLASAREVLSSSWLLALADTPFVLAYLVAIYVLGGPVVVVPLTVSVMMVLAHWALHVPGSRYAEHASMAQTRKVAVLAEVLAGGEVVRATHLRNVLGRRFGQLAEAGALAQARSRYWHHLAHHVSSIAMTASTVGVIVAGVYRIEAREMSVGMLVACSMLATRMVALLSGLTQMLSRVGELRSASRKLEALLHDDTATDVPTDAASAQWQARGNSLSLRNVRFEHDPKRPLIDGLSLDVAPGQFVVLLGKPGAGKSTLLKLLGGQLKPGRGDAMLDGHSLVDWPAAVRAQRLNFKAQEAVLFEGTLAENLVGGAEAQVTQASFEAALAVSGLDQWIAAGELSLSQRLLPGGVNLSGGQRQVIALARALVTDPPVLLLDEPTSGLDQQTEQAIVARLRRWAQGRTVVVATHSLALVNVADRLIVVDAGRVIADGPKELVLMRPQAGAPGSPGAPGARTAPPADAAPASAGTAPPMPAAAPRPSGVFAEGGVPRRASVPDPAG